MLGRLRHAAPLRNREEDLQLSELEPAARVL
jgi:hypothetical protein